MTKSAITDAEVLQYALRYAQRGFRVFPVQPEGKAPCHQLIDSWKEEATTNREQIRRWWRDVSQANVGVATGEWEEHGKLFAVDIDVKGKADGYKTWKALCAEHPEEAPEPTLSVQTPSGGSHLYYRSPPGVQIKSAKDTLGPGVDTKGYGGYVVAPPSATADGEYAFSDGNVEEIVEAPFWLVSAAYRADPEKTQPSPGHSDRPDPELVEEALQAIPPHPDYDTWIRIIAAVKDGARSDREAAQMLERWSPEDRDGDYTYAERVRNAPDDHITVGTLYHIAERNGWTPPWKQNGAGRGGAAEEAEDTGGKAELRYEPFPVHVLPGPVRDYVRAAARSLGDEIPPAMVAVPTLSVLSGAIGDAAQLKLKRSWTEPATLWTVLVAPSGSTKSPAFKHAVRPIFRRESEARDEYEQALAQWKQQEEPDEQDKPTRDRYRTGDATPEAVVNILNENPRGILLARDELGAWIGSFDRYVNGAADLQFWVEVWQGIQASRDRVGEGNTTVDTPAVPVTGTIQPGTLKEKLDEIHFDTGFAARLILCRPPSKPKRWTEADVSRNVRDAYERTLARLYGTPRGQTLSLSQGAKAAWIEYYNEANADLEARPEGPAKAVAAKGITHSARLALILHLCRKASGETDANEVDVESMEGALEIGQWLTNETLRVYHELNLDDAALSPRLRFLGRLPDRFKTAEAKEIAEEDEIPERTCEKWLRDLVESSELEKIKRGLYRKS